MSDCDCDCDCFGNSDGCCDDVGGGPEDTEHMELPQLVK